MWVRERTLYESTLKAASKQHCTPPFRFLRLSRPAACKLGASGWPQDSNLNLSLVVCVLDVDREEKAEIAQHSTGLTTKVAARTLRIKIGDQARTSLIPQLRVATPVRHLRSGGRSPLLLFLISIQRSDAFETVLWPRRISLHNILFFVIRDNKR